MILVRVALLGLLTLVLGCQSALVPPPSLAEAEGLLRQAITDARAGQFDALCKLGGGSCERILGEAGRLAPRSAPRVVGSRIQQPTQTRHGGVVLEICGVTDAGGVYYSEMVVFRDNDRLLAIEPVYWSGYGIADDLNVGPRVGDPAERCK